MKKHAEIFEDFVNIQLNFFENMLCTYLFLIHVHIYNYILIILGLQCMC